MTEVGYGPREQAPQGTRVTSWWIQGSRERYGEALFVSTETRFMRDGGVEEWTTVWQNRRPYAANEKIATVRERPRTWEEIDDIVRKAGF